MEKYLNPALPPEERAEDLLTKMSLEEKMGQVVGYFPRGLGETAVLREKYPQGSAERLPLTRNSRSRPAIW